ncbi:MAG: hypothetical protein AAGI01_17820 [Myxococcota bacterium]
MASSFVPTLVMMGAGVLAFVGMILLFFGSTRDLDGDLNQKLVSAGTALMSMPVLALVAYLLVLVVRGVA